MIRFSCRCSHEFLVADDQAGGTVQCPKCGLLNDIPTLSDLANIEDGGIFKVGQRPDLTGRPPRVLSDTSRAFTREKQDDAGSDIDMRLNLDEFMAIGAEEIPLELKDEVLPGAPKYDPATGELIAPMDVKKESAAIDPNSIPMAQAAIAYASGTTAKHVSSGRILLELFQPINALVMFFIFIAYIVAAFMAFPLMVIAALIGLPGIVLNIPMFLIMAHYANVIEEIAMGNSDELPRPLRNIDFYDDIWGPFSRFMLALMICYWPIVAVGMLSGRSKIDADPIILLVNLVCSFFFPAVALTTITSGSLLNLRPDRVLKVISLSGTAYFVSVISWLIVQTLGAWAIGGRHMIPNFLITKLLGLQALNNYGIDVFAIFVSSRAAASNGYGFCAPPRKRYTP